jgi:hypothetical protein
MYLARMILIGLVTLVGFSAAATAFPVTQIQVRITTSSVTGAGTNAKVFLGIGGREFRLDSANPCGDFETGQDVIYTLGVNANANFLSNPGLIPGTARPCPTGMSAIEAAEDNDPRHPQIDTNFIDQPNTTPTYIRMSDVSFDNANPLTWPADDWLVSFVQVFVFIGPNPDPNPKDIFILPFNSPEPLRLGRESGFRLYLIQD